MKKGVVKYPSLDERKVLFQKIIGAPWKEEIVRLKAHKTYSNLADYKKLKSVLNTTVFWWNPNLEPGLENVGQDPDPGGMLDSFDTRPVKHLKSKSSKVSWEKTPLNKLLW